MKSTPFKPGDDLIQYIIYEIVAQEKLNKIKILFSWQREEK